MEVVNTGWRILKCPACGGNLNLETDRDVIFCQYCGAKLQKTDDRIVIEHIDRHVDETENKRIDLEEKKFESRKKSRHSFNVIALILLIIGLVGLMISGRRPLVPMFILMIAGLVWMSGGI